MMPIVTLSEGLREFRKLLSEYCGEPKILPPDDALAMQECCDAMIVRAKALEMCIAHGRSSEKLIEEVQKTDSNVKLFPMVPRAEPKDAPQGGAA